MSGTQDRAEGLLALRVSTINPGANPVNSLKGIDISSIPQGSTVWVTDDEVKYRWDETSTAVANDDSVVQPTGVTGAGRWLKVFGGGSTFDHVISSRTDLENVVAPVAGNFALPSGSYAIVGDVVLDTAETVSIEGGANVYIWADVEGRELSSDGAGGPTLTVADGTAYISNLTIVATDNDESAMLVNNAAAVVKMWGVQVKGDPTVTVSASGLEVTAGAVWVNGSFFTSDKRAIEVSGGELYLINCDLVGGSATVADALYLTGGEVYMSNSRAVASAGSAIFTDSNTVKVWVSNCRMNTTSPFAVVWLESVLLCKVSGGLLDGPGITLSAGFNVRSNGGQLIASGVTFTNCIHCMRRNVNQMKSVIMTGCQAESNCDNGVSSALAGTPTDGLLIDGFAFAGTGSFLDGGILISSPRVNVKASLNAAGLQAETAIVP